MLACPPGEQHDIPLLAFGIVLHRSGWRVDYIGADTPVGDLVRTATETRPALAVLAATRPERFAGVTATWPGWPRSSRWPWPERGQRRPWPVLSAPGSWAAIPVTEAQALIPPARHHAPARPIVTGSDPAIKPPSANKPGIME